MKLCYGVAVCLVLKDLIDMEKIKLEADDEIKLKVCISRVKYIQHLSSPDWDFCTWSWDKIVRSNFLSDLPSFLLKDFIESLIYGTVYHFSI